MQRWHIASFEQVMVLSVCRLQPGFRLPVPSAASPAGAVAANSRERGSLLARRRQTSSGSPPFFGPISPICRDRVETTPLPAYAIPGRFCK